MNSSRKTMQLFRADRFCDDKGNLQCRVMALPLSPDLPDGRKLIRPRVVQDGPGAVLEFMDQGLSRQGQAYGAPNDMNIATNIPGLSAALPGSMAMASVSMHLGDPLDDAMRRTVPITCCRLKRVKDGEASESQVYYAGAGWKSSYSSYNTDTIVARVMGDLMQTKFGIPGDRRYEYNGELSKEDSVKYKTLIEGVRKLELVDWSLSPLRLSGVGSYLNAACDYVKAKGSERNRRHVTPDDLFDAGLIDSVDDCVLVHTSEYGWRGIDKPYKLRLIPLEAVPLEKLQGGYLPPKALKLEPGVTAQQVLSRSLDNGVNWDSYEPGFKWAQIVYAKVTKI